MREKKALDVAIGEKIRHYRTLAHITQAQLAERLSKSTNHISDIERGLTGVSPLMILELCSIFNITADALLCGVAATVLSSDKNLQKICEKIGQVAPRALPPLEKIIDAYLEATAESTIKNNKSG